MRKITLFLMSLFLTVGAMAQTETTFADGVYKIHWSWDGRGYLAYHNDYPTSPQLAGVINHNPNGHYKLTDQGVNLGWYLYTSPVSGKSYMFEATTGKFITLDRSKSIGTNGAIGCKLEDTVGNDAQLVLKATTNVNGYMLSNDRYNLCSGCGSDKGNDPVRFATDGQKDGGVPFVFVSEGVTIADDVKNAAIAKIEAFESTLYPYHGKIYALDSYMNYLYSNTNGSMNVYTNGSYNGVADTRALWKFEYNYNQGSYNIKNVHTGLYIGATNHAQSVAMSETPGNYEVATQVGSETVENGKYYIKVKGQNACLHSTSETAKGWQGGGLGNQYAFNEVTAFSHTLNIGATGWATLILGFPAEIPAIEGNEISVFIATESAVANSVHLTKIEEGVLPANTAVIVKANPNSTIEFKYSAETPVEINGNLLTGTLYDKNITENAYVLTADATDENGVCFGLAAKNQAGNTFKNNANKAYLPATIGASLSASLRFNFGGTTAIEEVETEAAETVIYDLTGRRVNEITKAGVYIINGRKVLVK